MQSISTVINQAVESIETEYFEEVFLVVVISGILGSNLGKIA